MSTAEARPRSRWMADRSVRTKILGAVALASVTAVGVGVLAVDRLGDLRDARAQELSSSLPYMDALADIAVTAKATANDERGYLLTADPDFAEEVDSRLEKISGLFDDARAAAATPEERAFLDELQVGVDAWSASMQSEFVLFATDPQAAVAQAMGQTRDLRKVYEEVLTQGQQDAEELLTTGAGYEQAVSDAARTMVVVCALGVLVAVIVGWLVAGSVTRGLGRLRRAAERLAAGDLTADVGLDQRDEVGRTAAALDGALGQLRTVMSTVASSADAVAASSEELSASSAQISASAEET
ncbi:HAMP domain-containing protein, partial [Modestobacter sp. I12A-02662]|uniref:HAMP domain-containing protein n=1 Tax=Modestobacter sp. I12A-02662 TaxID=1730496 RepID=UPI0034DF91D5